MIYRLLLTAFAILLLLQSLNAQTPIPQKVKVRGVELTYIESGIGEPLILLHGGQADYRSWLPHLPALSPRFRAIAYSRRYNYPNDNPIAPGDHSAYVEAEDLAAFIKNLGLKRVHLVGTSIGAYAALIVAVKHPKMVASLVLAEPNLHAWVEDSPEFKEFFNKAWVPAADAFRAGNDRDGMRYLVDIFGGTGSFDRMTPLAAETAMQNSRFFKAATLSKDHSPDIAREKVRQLGMPIMIISGENTFPMAKRIVEELERVLPNADRTILPKVGHASPRQNPAAFTDAVLKFLDKHKFGTPNRQNN